jgi:hypothetical protein
MTRNEILQWHILGFGLSGAEEDLGHSTTFLQLWKDVREKCFDCDRDEVLDALYTMPGERASLIKLVSTGEDSHPVSFERVRNTVGWPDYFATGEFHVKVLPEGRAYYQQLREQLELTAAH